MPTITVEIDTDANVRVSVEGCPGPVCKDLTRKLEAALGETVSDSPTREMNQQTHLRSKQVLKQ